jgi:hypothetical protein
MPSPDQHGLRDKGQKAGTGFGKQQNFSSAEMLEFEKVRG